MILSTLMETIAVSAEHALQQQVSDLLALSDAVAAALYPGAYRRPITAASLDQPGTHVFVARIAGRAMGLCVLFDRGDGSVELKRMIVDETARGKGVGLALLRGAEAAAMQLGAKTVLLEVGTRNLAAQALYAGAGYQPCDPFAPYQPSVISLFMARELAVEREAGLVS